MANKVQLLVDADTAGAVSGFMKLVEAQRKGESGAKKYSKTLKDQDGQFAKMTRTIAGYAGGILSIAGAIGQVSAAMTDIRRTADEAGRRVSTVAEGNARLAQISDLNDPESLKKNIALRDSLRSRYGMGVSEANNVTEAAINAGLSQHLDLFARGRIIGFNPTEAIAGTQKMVANFGAGAGSVNQIINKTLAASGGSPVQAGRIASVVAKSAAKFTGAFGSEMDEDMLALTSIMTQSAGTEDLAGTAIGSFSDMLNKYRGKIDQQLGVSTAGMSPGEVLDVMVRKQQSGQFNAAASLGEGAQLVEMFAKNRGQYMGALSRIKQAEADTGGAGDILRNRAMLAVNDPQIAADMARRIEEEKLKMAQEGRYGIAENLSDARLARKQRIALDMGRPLTGYLKAQEHEWGAWAWGPGFTAKNVGDSEMDPTSAGYRPSGKILSGFGEMVESMDRSAAALEGASSDLRHTASQADYDSANEQILNNPHLEGGR